MTGKRILAVLLTAAMTLSLPEGFSASGTEDGSTAFAITSLLTNGALNPIGLDDETPSFSWRMESQEIAAAQTSYQIVVKDPDGEIVWDSGEVESADSVDIPYEGEDLRERTPYSWTVTVRGKDGERVSSARASFETGLMSESLEAWDGAKFIGAPCLSLDAGTLAVYNISTDVTIPEGSDSASLIFGGNDFRLRQESFNTDRLAGENYVRLELDLSDVTKDGGAKFNLYRAGYFAGDDPDVPLQTIGDLEDLNSLITEENAHEKIHLDVRVCASGISLAVNGTDLLIKEKVQVNRLGLDSSSNAFPLLASVGFAAKAGQQAVFTDYLVQNGGNYGTGTLFGESTGASYQIFEGLDGILVEGNTISVDGGKDGIVSYADPSFGASPMIRTEFEASSKPASARLYLTSHGIYNYYINGQKLAPEEYFNPGASEYDQLLAYKTYDVTDLLGEGKNAMGAVLGEGWWTGNMTYEASNSNYYGDSPALMAKLLLTYEDGTSDVIVTDPASWKSFHDGPVRTASFLQGEKYDATKEDLVEGWTEAGFDDSSWEEAPEIETRKVFQNARFYTRTDLPVHVIRTLTPVEALGESLAGSGSYVYDMGENVSGIPRITIPDEMAKAGETITIRYAEILYPENEEYKAQGIDGMLMVENYRAALVTDFYTMKESGNVFCPDLTFHGYRYIEITGLDRELPAENIQMLVLSSLDRTVEYHTSNALTNRLFENICNSTTSNYISIPTDCPQRNERMGWVGDAQVFGLSASYVADSYNFLEQWMRNVVSSSGENGMSKQYCPAFDPYTAEDEAITHKGQSFGITWNAVAVTIPYNLYLQTGRLDIVEENIDNINRYMDTLISTPYEYKDAEKNKISEARLTGETGTLSDHLGRVVTDGKLLGNAVFYGILKQASALNLALGNTEKAEEYSKKAAEVREAWNQLFLNEDGITVNAKGDIQNTQASYATPLRYGVISDENLEKVLENYKKTIEKPEGEDTDGIAITPYTLTSGFNGTGNLLPALTAYGEVDCAYALFESTDYASWLYPVTQGATSIWERWNSYTEENAFGGNNSMNSFNHYSLGAVLEWMMGSQLGITPDAEEAGYQHFILQPIPGGTFTEAGGSYDSPYGVIRSAWTREDGVLSCYDVTVPANTSADLYLPASGEVTLTEGVSGGEREVHNGIDSTKFVLLSGSYHFEVKDGAITVTAKPAETGR